MKIAIVGLGLIGCERIEALNNIINATDNKITISSVYDLNNEQALKIKNKYNLSVASNIDELFEAKPDWTFIATSNDSVKEIARKAFDSKSNVLLEKPFGRSLEECDQIIALKPEDCQLHVGFNYRFFAGVEAALNDAKSGKFGRLISVNMILAHGNSPGMEKSWKLDPVKCGGCITDLGVHLFDLSSQLSIGQLKINYAKSWKGFWNTGIDEENHWIATDENNTIFNCQVSLNRWRSNFRLEINGTEGYGIVTNRGRSYGPQSYVTGKRWGWTSGISQIDSETIVINKNSCTDSFIKETASLLGIKSIKDFNSNLNSCSYIEARNIMLLLEQYNKICSRG